MKFLKLGLLMLSVVKLSAGKVTWDANGKPIVSQSSKPIKGCNQGGFEAIIADNNSSSSCS